MLFRHGSSTKFSKLVLERTLDLYGRDWVSKYDLHGVGFLRRNHGARRIIHRAESRFGGRRARDSRNRYDSASRPLLQGSFPEGTGPDRIFAGIIFSSMGPRILADRREIAILTTLSLRWIRILFPSNWNCSISS